ncbi:MAG: hypothetical protein IKA46_02825 [Clostridia bacterium]|nr:hypothetical protein [Clostridia bacterium]
MARRATYEPYRLPHCVVQIVTSICADYERRAVILREGKCGEEPCEDAILARYREFNGAVDRALEQVEVGIRRDLLCDVALGRGYRRSAVQYILSKNAYYRRRHKLMHDIAKGLRLL